MPAVVKTVAQALAEGASLEVEATCRETTEMPYSLSERERLVLESPWLKLVINSHHQALGLVVGRKYRITFEDVTEGG